MNLYLLGTILNFSAILMTAACGSYFSIKGGNYNLGGEGQIYTGCFTASVCLCALKNLPAVIAVPLSFLAAGAVAGLMALIPALLKQFRKVDVLLSSFLLSAGMIPVIDYFVAGPFRGDTNNLLATEFIPKAFRFPSIMKPSALNGSIFVALAFCLILFYIIYRTSFGQQLSVMGISPDFAAYSGYAIPKLTIVSVTVSGFFHGIAGFFFVAGTYFTCHSGFYAGFGWNALSVALISAGNPLLIIPSAVILAALTTGATQFSMMHNFGFDMGAMLQGVILFVIVLFAALIPELQKKLHASALIKGSAK